MTSMKFPLLCVGFLLTTISSLTAEDSLHPATDDASFTTLYAGKDLSKLDTEGNWLIQPDGSLQLQPREGESGWKRYGSYLWLQGDYADFIFDFEFQFGEQGNSGFYFRVADTVDPTKSGFEVQILDSHGAEKTLGHHDMGGVIRTRGPLKNAAKPAGEWQRMTVTMRGDHLKVVLNGKIIQDFDLRQGKPEGKELVASGKICIQDHGQPFSVRNLRVKRL